MSVTYIILNSNSVFRFYRLLGW